MTSGAVLKAASAGTARRLAQTVVVFIVVTVATGTAIEGLALATNTYKAFLDEFTKHHSADLAVTIDATKVTSAQLAGTRHLPGVRQAVGYPATTITMSIPVPRDMSPTGRNSGSLTVVGRRSRSGPLDDITHLNGRWFTRVGEIALSIYSQTRGSDGQSVTATVTSVRGRPKIYVTGYAAPSVQDQTQDAWAMPAEITALEKAGAPRQEQMLYTFRRAATPAQMSADLSEVKAALPAGAIVDSSTWLNTKYSAGAAGSTFVAPTLAYAIIALALALVIIATVVAAAVAAGYRRIGVLKSIGFTPAQVAATYLVQLAIPALAGAVAGTALGNHWAHAQLRTDPYRMSLGGPALIDICVPLAICILVGLAALVPALRAGRRPAAAAIAAGQAPRAGRGYAVHRLAARLSLPRSASLGLAAPFTRPAPSLATTAVTAAGLTAVVLAVGLYAQMTSIVIVIGSAYIERALVRELAKLIAVLAALGVFCPVLMLARERVHDLGIFKALGMTPRQVIAMVTCWVIAPAIAAAVIALPVGVAIEGTVARAIVSGQASRLQLVVAPGGAQAQVPQPPPGQAKSPGGGRHPRLFTKPGGQRVIDLPRGARPRPPIPSAPPALAPVYTPGALTLLALAGLAIAIAGALGPAIWAAASRTITALRAE